MISVPAVEEISYRQSWLCRLLGNPVAFTVVSLLADSKEMSTGEIARAIGRSVPRTSNILGALRLAELVRYETEGRHARYKLKHPLEVRRRALRICKNDIRGPRLTRRRCLQAFATFMFSQLRKHEMLLKERWLSHSFLAPRLKKPRELTVAKPGFFTGGMTASPARVLWLEIFLYGVRQWK
jgi:DNA-binding transcriptional ArsR family regulator